MQLAVLAVVQLGRGGGAHYRITIFTFILTVTLSTIIFGERTNLRHVNRQAIKTKNKNKNYNVLTKSSTDQSSGAV